MKRFKVLARNKSLSHGSFRILTVLAMLADDQGRAWPGLNTLAEAAGFSRKGVTKIMPILERDQYLKIQKLKPGNKLPNGNQASRQRSIYWLSESVCGAPSALEQTHSQGVLSTPEGHIGSGVPSSLEPSTLAPVYSVPSSGVPSTLSLHDQDLNKTKNDRDRTCTRVEMPNKWAKPETRIEKTSHLIRENKPLDPHKFLLAVNEAKEDKKTIPYNVDNAIKKLVINNRMELIDGGKIFSPGWDTPTPLSVLLKCDLKSNKQSEVKNIVAKIISNFDLD